MDSSSSIADILRRSREELTVLRERDAKWTRLVDLLEDKLRCVQWHLHNEKGERMKADADIICLRRALGPSSLTLLRDRLKTEETRVCFVFTLSIFRIIY